MSTPLPDIGILLLLLYLILPLFSTISNTADNLVAFLFTLGKYLDFDHTNLLKNKSRSESG